MASRQIRLSVPKPLPMGYVVHCATYVQDGSESSADLFPTLEAALAHVNKYATVWGAKTSFRLFTLGKEIPLARETVEEPQPPKTRSRYVVSAPGEGEPKGESVT